MNNPKQVSIRLSGGHSFSVVGRAELASVELVEWLTPHTVVVPRELFREEQAEALLAANGLSVEPGLRCVWSNPQEPIVAVMAVPEEALTALPEGVQHTSPLVHIPTVLEPTVWICDMDSLIYIKVYDPTLQCAEVVPLSGEADRTYLVERLLDRIDVERFVLMLDDRAKQLGYYKRHFKKVICE